MKIILFNTFKKKDPKNLIVIETKGGMTKAYCLHPFPDSTSCNPTMSFDLGQHDSITVYVDTASGSQKHTEKARYKIEYPKGWYDKKNQSDEIRFNTMPDTHAPGKPGEKYATSKFKKKDPRETAWSFKIFYSQNAAESNHPVEVGDNNQ
jgi:hypothetical protein